MCKYVYYPLSGVMGVRTAGKSGKLKISAAVIVEFCIDRIEEKGVKEIIGGWFPLIKGGGYAY